MMTLAWPRPGLAAKVLIVKASEAEPYTQAEAAVRGPLTQHHDDVRTVVLNEVIDKGVAQVVGPADMVIAIGTPAARGLHNQLPANIKLVYCMVTNPEDAGLLQGPGAWGVTTEVTVADQFKLMAEALPNARTVGLLYRSDTLEGKRHVEAARAVLPGDWHLQAVAVNDTPSFAAAIDLLTQKKVDVIWTSPDPKLFDAASVRALLLAGLRARVPVWGFSPAFVRAGALLGVGVEPKAQGTQAAEIALAVLAGQACAKGFAQPPHEFNIAVNLIVAQQIGLELPESLVRRATYVYRPEN